MTTHKILILIKFINRSRNIKPFLIVVYYLIKIKNQVLLTVKNMKKRRKYTILTQINFVYQKSLKETFETGCLVQNHLLNLCSRAVIS